MTQDSLTKTATTTPAAPRGSTAAPQQSRGRLLILSQVYVPDPAAVGQHLHDFAAHMAARGHDVYVYCSSRGYDDPSRRYPKREERDGVHIRRYSLPVYNKRNMLARIIGSAWAMASLVFMALFTRRVGCIFFSTSPPLVGFAATLVAMVKRVPRVYWAMDLNPDQLLAMGKVKPGSLLHRALERVNRFVLRHANLTIALDRFMEQRLRAGGRRPGGEVIVLPPWAQEEITTPLTHEENWFRDKHGLRGKFVVMYSGNHSPSNPLDTLLQAAERLRDEPKLQFAFIGGGMGKPAVEAFVTQHGLTNVLSLPYQPMSDLRYSLSAADVHVVSLGSEMVGIVHPCKVYGAMALGRPVLFLGPAPSHVSDLLERHGIGWHVAHGDVDGCVATIRRILTTPASALAEMGRLAQRVLESELAPNELCDRMGEAVERTFVRAKS
jgi:glycosyltransferase involved in cell wall biosynthesis